jgi:hypothetical protein
MWFEEVLGFRSHIQNIRQEILQLKAHYAAELEADEAERPYCKWNQLKAFSRFQ